MTLTDQDLVLTLEAALRTAALEPSPAELDAFRLVVAEQRAGQALPAPVARTSTRTSGFGRRPLTVALAATLSTVLGSGVAFAAGAPMPRAVRSVASSIGLPVDSPAFIDAEHSLDALRNALAGDDHDAIRTSRDDLRGRLATLDPGERARLDAEADPLLHRADLRLAPATARGRVADGSTDPDQADDSPGSREGPETSGGDDPADEDRSGPSDPDGSGSDSGSDDSGSNSGSDDSGSDDSGSNSGSDDSGSDGSGSNSGSGSDSGSNSGSGSNGDASGSDGSGH